MGRVKAKSYKGGVETPYSLALYMVDKLFRDRPPGPKSRLLDAGCGRGVFIRAVIDWCRARGIEPPEIVGVELDEGLARKVRKRFRGHGRVGIVQGDLLLMPKARLGEFDYIISNPPYVSYEKISEGTRRTYGRAFRVAVGRFDLYMLFFEKAIDLLRPNGRLVFITPEKYLYVLSARELRKMLARYRVEEIEMVNENAFGNVLAYPTITVLTKTERGDGMTRIILRSGEELLVRLPADGGSWLPAIGRRGVEHAIVYRYRLADAALRISPGVATGRDGIFVVLRRLLPRELEPYAYPTVSGSELEGLRPGKAVDPGRLNSVIIVPYDGEGNLLDEDRAAPIIRYLSRWRDELEARYAVRAKGKKWYAFHEEPPMKPLLRPKILWPDIAREPAFYVDTSGTIIPRHNVYYLVPKNPEAIPRLLQHLNSVETREWIERHCQRAASGYIRLQSHILKELPIPDELYKEAIKPPKADAGVGIVKWLKTGWKT